LICRFYPFQLRNPRNNEYVFGYTKECPGIGEGPQLRKTFFEQLFRDSIDSIRKSKPISSQRKFWLIALQLTGGILNAS